MKFIENHDATRRINVFHFEVSDEEMDFLRNHKSITRLKIESDATGKYSDKLGYLAEIAFCLENKV